MDLNDYEKIAHLICWPQFIEEQKEIRQREFDTLYDKKYRDYKSIKRTIRGCIGHGGKVLFSDGVLLMLT